MSATKIPQSSNPLRARPSVPRGYIAQRVAVLDLAEIRITFRAPRFLLGGGGCGGCGYAGCGYVGWLMDGDPCSWLVGLRMLTGAHPSWVKAVSLALQRG